jgi:hypothetical protein
LSDDTAMMPRLGGKAQLPVMVWIHRGSNRSGWQN